MPADLEHFKELTYGKSVIMGRKTFMSLPEHVRPLPGRQNIVLSLSQKAIEGTLVATSIGDAYSMADAEPVVIGGAKVYKEALPTVNKVHVTEINTVVEDGDAHFPRLSPLEWELAEYETVHDARDAFLSSYATYLRRKPIQE